MIKSNARKTTSRLLSTSTLAVSLVASLIPSQAFAIDDLALPTNGQVIGGSASFNNPSAGVLNIKQNTDRVVINWDSFNIGKNATTEFFQNNSKSLAVNRVTGDKSDPTQILGTLKANGRVMVLDRNGVFFGKDAIIDVGSIVASTGDVDTSAVVRGDATLKLSNFGDGAVINEGTINVQDAGLAAFVAPTVVNNGVINAKLGKVALAAGGESATVDLYGDGLVELALNDEKTDALVKNAGVINAEGGTVALTASAAKDAVDEVINVSGIVNVSSVEVKGGKIILSGGKSGKVKVSGKLNANGKTGGGKIDVKGKDIEVTKDALFMADAYQAGNGGVIDVIADNDTAFEGDVYARGGALSGNGGAVEISGHGRLGYDGSVNTTAANGQGGSLLFDPEFAIIHSGSLHTSYFGLDYILSAQALANDLGKNGSVTVLATNSIDVGTNLGILGTGPIDMSHYNYNALEVTGYFFGIPIYGIVNHSGTTSGLVTLNAATINFNKDLKLGTGDLNVVANTVNLNSKLSDVNGLLKQSDITTTASAVNVLSNAAQIQQGLYLAKSGGTVEVSNGTYNENLNIAKAVKLQSKNGSATTTIAGQATAAPATIVIAEDLNNVQIGDTNKGFKVAGQKDGLKITRGANIVVKGNEFSSLGGKAIYAQGIYAGAFAKLELTDNIFTNTTSDAIYIKMWNGAKIAGNTINGTVYGDGVQLELTTNTEVSGNNIKDVASAGIDLWYGNEGTKIQSNTIANSKYGVLIQPHDSNINTIIGAGFADDPATKANTITGGVIGIKVEGGQNLRVAGNVISGQSDAGINILNAGGAYTNIYFNKINSTKDGILVSGTPALIADNRIGLIGNLSGNGIVVSSSDNAQVLSNQISNAALDGVKVTGGTNVRVETNELNSIAQSGILADGAGNIIVKGNKVTTANAGIKLSNLDGATVTRNTVDGAKTGISLNAVTNSTIGGSVANKNTIKNIALGWNNSGINLNGGSGITVNNNVLENIGGNALFAENVGTLVVSDNTITNAEHNAVYLKKINGGKVTGNTITGMTYGDGVQLELTNGALVTGNTIKNTSNAGVNLSYGNDGAKIQTNTIDNSQYGVLVGSASSNANTVVGFGFGEDPAAKANTITGGKIGVKVDGGENLRVAGNIISGQSDAGIDIANAGGAYTILDFNKINATKDGIRVTGTPALITDNRIGLVGNLTGNGIVVTSSDGAQILTNQISNTAKSGIRINAGSKNISISDNVLKAIGNEGIYANQVQTLTVQRNKLDNVSWNGLQVEGGNNALISKNTLTGIRGNGIQLSGTSAATIKGNDISGIRVSGIVANGTQNATIEENVINGIGADAISAAGNASLKVLKNYIGYTDKVGTLGTLNNVAGSGINLLYGNTGAVIQSNAINAAQNGIVIGTQTGQAQNANTLIGAGFADDPALKANTIVGGSIGVKVNGGENSRIAGNVISGQGDAGIDIANAGGAFTTVYFNKINATKDGIRVTGTPALIADNRLGLTNALTGNGIVVSASDGAQVLSNQVSNAAKTGIRINSGSKNIEISDNILKAIGNEGIRANQVNTLIVQRNNLDNVSWNGIDVQGGNNANIGRNALNNVRGNGIQVSGTNTVAVKDNNLGGIRVTGIVVNDAKNVRIEENVVRDTGADAVLAARNEALEVLKNFIGYSDKLGTSGAADNVKGNGVSVKSSKDVTIAGNKVTNTKSDGVAVSGGSNLTVGGVNTSLANTIINAGDDGIEVSGTAGAVLIARNTVTSATNDGVDVQGVADLVVRNNKVNSTVAISSNGISIKDSTGAIVNNNDVVNAGGNGIYVLSSNGSDIRKNEVTNAVLSGIVVDSSDNVTIGGTVAQANIVSGTQLGSGIKVLGGADNLVRNNLVRNTGDDGIKASGTADLTVSDNTITGANGDAVSVTSGKRTSVLRNIISGFFGNGVVIDGNNSTAQIVKNDIRLSTGSSSNGIFATDANRVVVRKNTIANLSGNGIQVSRTDNVNIRDINNIDRVLGNGIDLRNNTKVTVDANVINRAARNGVLLRGNGNVNLISNLITNSGARGLYAAGANNGSVVLVGNTLTGNDIGAEFESGAIDLTGLGNTINGGTVGLRFDQASPLSPVSLVNNTFGETFFNGQAQYYIQLANGAFFAPGNPSVLDATASIFDGFRPDTQAFLTLAQYNELESRIYHFADNATLGLIFFGALPEIDQEDILRQIAGFRASGTGLNITIRGLPMVTANAALRAASGGNTALALANIAPAAGGDEIASAESVANIEPAAGDEQVEQTSCWSDAAAGAAGGATMSYSFGGSSDSILSSAAGGCQSGSF